jgi:hypothetical protein
MMSKNMDDDSTHLSQASDRKRKGSELESGSKVLDKNDKSETKVSDSNKTKFMYALQISTVVDGYNSGRSYYLKAHSEEMCQKIVSSLQIIAKAAMKQARAWSWFRRVQRKVRRVHDSTPFQLAVASLIIAVILREGGREK